MRHNLKYAPSYYNTEHFSLTLLVLTGSRAAPLSPPAPPARSCRGRSLPPPRAWGRAPSAWPRPGGWHQPMARARGRGQKLRTGYQRGTKGRATWLTYRVTEARATQRSATRRRRSSEAPEVENRLLVRSGPRSRGGSHRPGAPGGVSPWPGERGIIGNS